MGLSAAWGPAGTVQSVDGPGEVVKDLVRLCDHTGDWLGAAGLGLAGWVEEGRVIADGEGSVVQLCLRLSRAR